MKHFLNAMILAVLILSGGTVFSGSARAASLDDFLNGTSLGRMDFSQVEFRAEGIAANTAAPAPAYRRAGSFMGKFHKYAGYGTLVAAAAAGLSGSQGDGFHKGAGDTAAVLAVAACASGFSEYSHYFDIDEGLSPYNIHIVLATLATAGFVATAVDANNSDNNDDDDDDGGHAGLGIGSTILVVVPVVVLHF